MDNIEKIKLKGTEYEIGGGSKLYKHDIIIKLDESGLSNGYALWELYFSVYTTNNTPLTDWETLYSILPTYTQVVAYDITNSDPAHTDVKKYIGMLSYNVYGDAGEQIFVRGNEKDGSDYYCMAQPTADYIIITDTIKEV